MVIAKAIYDLAGELNAEGNSAADILPQITVAVWDPDEEFRDKIHHPFVTVFSNPDFYKNYDCADVGTRITDPARSLRDKLRKGDIDPGDLPFELIDMQGDNALAIDKPANCDETSRTIVHLPKRGSRKDGPGNDGPKRP